MDVLRRRNDLSTSPSLSCTDKMFPPKLCNLFVFLALHHCPSKPFTPPASRLSTGPLPDCLSIKSLQHSISTFHTYFTLLRITCRLQTRNIYEGGHKGHGWPKQLLRDLISHVSPHNLTQERAEENGREKRLERQKGLNERVEKKTIGINGDFRPY